MPIEIENAKGRCLRAPAQRLTGDAFRGTPPVSAILPKKSLRTALEWEEVCSASNRHFHVSRYHRSCRSTPISTGRERPSGNSRATLPRQSRRGPTERRRNARFRKGAARRPDHLADGGHRRLSRTGGASHRRGHHPHGPGRLGDEKRPLNGPGPSERKPGRAFTYHHAALGQSETYPSAPANP